MDAIAKYSAVQDTKQKNRKKQPLGDSEVLPGAFREKQVAHCRASPLQFCLNHFHILFYQAICKTLHCCIIAVGFGTGLHHESPPAYHSQS